jgi:hypothetical protein
LSRHLGRAGIVDTMAPYGEDLATVIGTPLSDEEAAQLSAWYAALSRAISAFPAADLKAVEPPLRSIPGPAAP